MDNENGSIQVDANGNLIVFDNFDSSQLEEYKKQLAQQQAQQEEESK